MYLLCFVYNIEVLVNIYKIILNQTNRKINYSPELSQLFVIKIFLINSHLFDGFKFSAISFVNQIN